MFIKNAILIVVVLLLAGCKPTLIPTTIPSPGLTTFPTTTSTPQEPIVASSPQSTPMNGYEPLPFLQTITPENAGDVRLLRTLKIPGFSISALSQCSVTFSPDGSLLTGVCYQNTIPVWDVRSGQLLLTLESTPSHEVAVAFSPDGDQIATGGFSNGIRLWNSATGELAGAFGKNPSPIWELAFSPDGDKLASAVFDYGLRLDSPGVTAVQLWDVSKQASLWNYTDGKTRPLVLSVDYAPDGKTIAYGTFNSVLIIEAETGKLIKLLPIPEHVGDLAFSSDGRVLVTGSDDRKIRLWSTDSYGLLATLEGHTHYVNGVAFSSDGKLIVSGSHDKRVGIWDIQSGQMLKLLEGHDSPVLRVDINPAGTLIASVGWDGTIRLWGIAE